LKTEQISPGFLSEDDFVRTSSQSRVDRTKRNLGRTRAIIGFPQICFAP